MVSVYFIAKKKAWSISFNFAARDSLLNHHFAALFIDYFSALPVFQLMHPSFSLLIFLRFGEFAPDEQYLLQPQVPYLLRVFSCTRHRI